MKRKAAFIITAFMTVLLMILRLLSPSIGAFSVGPLSYNDCLLILTLIAVAVIIVLCLSKKGVVVSPDTSKLGALNGWVCTFCGAVITMSAVLDTFCWIMYDQIPPPSTLITNSIDRVVLLAVLLLGALGGIALVIQGFCWMSQSDANKTLRSWFALAPVLWMWFRLARYEISYASTIDISESFFTFAILVFASLFFLQLARMISGVGAQPKSALLIFSLLTAMIALSGAPSELAQTADGQPIGFLLVAVVDLIVGCFAFTMALLQVFGAPRVLKEINASIEQDEEEPVAQEDMYSFDAQQESSEDGLAWTDPVRDLPPLEPAFQIDQLLPNIHKPSSSPAEHKPLSTIDKFAVVEPKKAPEAVAEPVKKQAPTPPASPAPVKPPVSSPVEPSAPASKTPVSELTVEDILSELDNF